MNKVIVNVYVPILNCSYDIFIPTGSQLFEVLELIKRAVSELSEGRFMPTENTTLSLRSSGEILNVNATVSELGIENGAKLMLI